MDLYRYFHPHHNPRLNKVPLRLQELAELEQAAAELKKAIERAEIRAANTNSQIIRSEHFTEIAAALDYVVSALSMLSEAHPGDDLDTLAQMLHERKDTPGWETWSKLLSQKLLSSPEAER